MGNCQRYRRSIFWRRRRLLAVVLVVVTVGTIVGTNPMIDAIDTHGNNKQLRCSFGDDDDGDDDNKHGVHRRSTQLQLHNQQPRSTSLCKLGAQPFDAIAHATHVHTLALEADSGSTLNHT